jgi:hypothetical protein
VACSMRMPRTPASFNPPLSASFGLALMIGHHFSISAF